MSHDGLILSGAYLVNGALLLGIGHVWRTATASKKALHDRLDVHGAGLAEAHTQIAVLETRLEAQSGDIKEIKSDVKLLLSRGS